MNWNKPNETYNSSTHGPIPLSFTGRRLLANERAAAEAAIEAEDFLTNDKALSKARGDLAQYMSKLEGQADVDFVVKPTIFGVDWGAAEARVLASAWRSPEQQAADEFLDAAREFNAARAKLVRCAEQAKFAGLKPTWCNPTALYPRGTRPQTFTDGKTFVPLAFEVSRTVTNLVPQAVTESMGREP